VVAGVIVLGAARSPAPLGAQVFQLQGGGSSLFEGYGGVLNVWGNGYEGSIGVGYLDGLRLGWSARRLVRQRDTLRLGNDALPVQFDTDVFGGGSAILVQGASLQRRRGRTTLQLFGGASAHAVAAPYFASNTPSRALAYGRLHYDVSRELSIAGHAVATDRQTLLAGARWTPRSGVALGATGGMGSGAPYGALALDARRPAFDIKAAYVAMGDGFRRASAPMPLQSELERENLLVTWRPLERLTLSAGRQHFRQDSSFVGLSRRATLNQVSATSRLLGASLSSGWFVSESQGVRNVSSALSARRAFGQRLDSEFYLLQVWEPAPSRVTTPVLILRESITPRLSLLQVITREPGRGRTSVALGGTVHTGLSSVSLDYQVAHSPYLTSNPFVQTIGLNARLQLGAYALTFGSFVTPDGKVHYSAQGSTFYYRGGAGGGSATSLNTTGRVARFVVTGRVVDEKGTPVDGAAVEVGGELVYTDSRGRFFVRRTTNGAVAIRVVLDDFLTPGTFELVEAPSTATPARDDRATLLTIVLRRVVRRSGGATSAADPGDLTVPGPEQPAP